MRTMTAKELIDGLAEYARIVEHNHATTPGRNVLADVKADPHGEVLYEVEETIAGMLDRHLTPDDMTALHPLVVAYREAITL